MALPTLNVTPGTGAAINTLPNAPAVTANSVSVALATDQAAVPISAANLPLPSGAAQDGADATGVTAPAGGSGIRGWLSGIYSKLSGTIAVSGTFWPVTQPVSLSSLPALATGSNTIGAVTQSSGPWGVTANITQIGATTFALGQTTMSASAPVAIASNQSAIPINAAAATTGGASTYAAIGGTGNALLTNSAVAVKSSAGTLYGVSLVNPNSSSVYVQVFDLAAGPVTLGTTVPKLAFWVPGGGAWEEKFTDVGILFANAITVAATTTATGATAPGTGISAHFYSK